MKDSIIGSQINSAVKNLVFKYARWLLLLAFLLYMAKGIPDKNTGIYYVDRNEIAVSQYLGKIYDSNVEPGVHYILPWPFGQVDKVPIKQMKTVIVDAFASKPQAPDKKIDIKDGAAISKSDQSAVLEPYCITGDNNIVRTTMLIKYNIINPVDYLFRGLITANNSQFIQNITASAIIHKLLVLSVDDILTIKKNEIEMAVKNKLQTQLDALKAGIGISFVEIKGINPPRNIQPFFDDVINARVDRQKMVHEGSSYRNMIIPEARSKADERLRAAESYKNEQIVHAQGLTSRFLSQLSKTKNSKQINQKKTYLDFISQTFPKLGELRVINPAEKQKNKKGSISGNLFETVYTPDLTDRSMEIKTRIHCPDPGMEYLLFPNESGFEDNHADLLKTLDVSNSAGSPLVLLTTEYQPTYFGIQMKAWQFKVPDDGYIFIKARIKESLYTHYLGWQIMNHFRKGWSQISLESSFFTVESLTRQAVTGRFRINSPANGQVHVSAKKENNWYVYDPLEPGLVFTGKFTPISYTDGDINLTAYLSMMAKSIKREALDKAITSVLKAFSHAVRTYETPPDPSKKFPYTVKLFIHLDEKSGIQGTAGVCTPGSIINVLTTKDLDQFVENTTHEMLHLYNSYAFAGKIDPQSGREADTYWVLEGFNEYTTHKWLYKTGFYTKKSFQNYMRGMTKFYLTSTWKNTYSLPAAARKYDDNDTFATVYIKGALAAMLFDQRLIQKGTNVDMDNLMALLHKRFNVNKGQHYNSRDVLTLMAQLAPGHDFVSDYKNWILGTRDLNFSWVPWLSEPKK
jgi:membrane protease subunit HflK